MRLIADKAFRYAGKPLAEGDDFEANTRDGRVLVALNRAHVAEEGEGSAPEQDVKKASAPDPTQDEKPDKKAAKKSVAKKAGKKRNYKRRDMQAEK